MTDSFFAKKDYKVPVTSNYMKLPEGTHKFRILGSSIVGYEYFNSDNRPVRSETPFEETPGIKSNGRIEHFWMFPVWSYGAERVQLLEISKKTIQDQMKSYIDNEEWGNPINAYDFTITRKGTSQNDTKYTVTVSPHKPTEPEILEKYKSMNINIDEIFTGGNPFGDK